MDFGGVDRRKTKKDLKRKRLVRGYKRGGKFRTANVDEEGKVVARNSVPFKKGTKVPASSGKMGKVIVGKADKKGKKRKY